MGFWHRNIDAHEIIFCVKGALKWETEMGVKIMHPGDMLFIPKGIGHRSMLCEDSTDDNVLIELKIADELTYVGRRQQVGEADVQSVDLVIADIDWLITVDPGRRIIRDAAIAVRRRQDRRGRQVGGDRRKHYAGKRKVDGRTHGGRRRASSTAICIPRSSSRAGWPTRPMRSRSCSTACIPTRRRSTARTCACPRRSPPPSCSSTA